MEFSEKQCQAIKIHLAQAGVELGEQYRFDHFGNSAEMASDLGKLVASGRKTATAAFGEVYSHYEIERPKVGDMEIICDFAGSLLAVIEMVDVRVVPFEEVSAEQARLEGEGDLSLEYWRRVHREYFEAECKAMGSHFSDRSPVLFQRFRLVYAPSV